MLRIAGAALMALALSAAGPALAEVGAKDVQVAAKTFGFTAPPMTGTVKVAIVYAEDAPGSKQDADALGGVLGGGLAAGQATLVPVLVPVSALDSGLEGAGAVFVTSGMSAHFDRIFDAARSRKLLSFTTDLDCVRAGRCVLGVRSEPKVEILVNKAAAEASSIAFAPAFRMMISEI